MRVLFRLDATTAVGWGHLKRCLALALALQGRGAVVQMAGHSGQPAVAELLAGHGMGWTELPPLGDGTVDQPAAAPQGDPAAAPAGAQAGDADACLAALAPHHPTLVVVDHYRLDSRWHQQMRARSGAFILVIDDLANRPLAPDLLVDHNPAKDHAAKYAAVLPANTPLCGGLAHALLDPVYASHPPADWHDTVQGIGIFMGGTDPAGHSAWVLDCLRQQVGWRGPVALATTRANPRLAALQALAAQDPMLALVVDQPHLADFHARCDLQVGAGGGASWERCCLGVPTVALVCAENQRQSLRPLARAGAACVVEAMAKSEAEAQRLAEAVNRLLGDSRLRAALRDKGRALVDGRGAERVATRVLVLLARQRLHLRPARLDDAALLLAWRNDPLTRQSSHQSALVDPADHQAWLLRSLQSPSRRLWLAELDGLPVGTLRADLGEAPQGGQEQTLSWTVAPALRGAGLGRAMVCLLARQLDGALHAEVKQGNTASLQIAQAAGLALDHTHQGTWHLRRPAG